MKNDDEKKPAWKPTSSELSETMATSANVAELAPVSKNQTYEKYAPSTTTRSPFPPFISHCPSSKFLFSTKTMSRLLFYLVVFASFSHFAQFHLSKQPYAKSKAIIALIVIFFFFQPWFEYRWRNHWHGRWNGEKNRWNSPHISTSSAFFCCLLSNRIVVSISWRLSHRIEGIESGKQIRQSHALRQRIISANGKKFCSGGLFLTSM